MDANMQCYNPTNPLLKWHSENWKKKNRKCTFSYADTVLYIIIMINGKCLRDNKIYTQMLYGNLLHGKLNCKNYGCIMWLYYLSQIENLCRCHIVYRYHVVYNNHY